MGKYHTGEDAMRHIKTHILFAYIHDEVPNNRLKSIQTHLHTCTKCSQKYQTLLGNIQFVLNQLEKLEPVYIPQDSSYHKLSQFLHRQNSGE